MELPIFNKFTQKPKAQGIVEFALTLPLLLILVFGIIEAGRLLFIYSAVLSSSREAARYGSAAGEITGYVPYYSDCNGIRAAAMRIGRFAGVSSTDVSISYDHGPGSSTNFAICPLGSNDHINLGDRITVQVVSTFKPLLPLVKFRPVPISAVTRRTIIKDVAIQGTPPSPVTPTISFVTANQTADEGAGKIKVMVQLTAAIDKTVTVPYSLTGTAQNLVDYSVSPNPVVLLPGDTVGEIQITINDDDIDEDDETAVLVMGTPTNAIKGTPFAHVATIKDNDNPPVVSFILADQSHPESMDGLAMLVLSNPSSRDITVNYSVGGDAQAGYDYSLTASPITIPALDVTFPIVLDIYDDLIDEVDETVILTLGDITNGTRGSPDVHIYTIEDDDEPPEVFFTWEKQSGDETVGTMTVEFQLSIESSLDITVPFNLGGTAARDADYKIDTTPVFIPAGELTGSVVITVIPDGDNTEGDETITVMIQNPVNARRGNPFKHTATITSEAMEPNVHFASANQRSDDSSDGRVEVKVLLSAAWSADVTVPLTFAGTATKDQDYTVSAESVVIPAGGASASIFVKFYDDAIDEFDETIEIIMGQPINATKGSPSVHIITIPDNDPESILSFVTNGQIVEEDAGIVTITAQLNVISGKDITAPFIVLGAAEAGVDKDYTISASPLFIPAGSSSADIQLQVNDDKLIELTEDVVIILDVPVNATLGSPATHTLKIEDNEPNCPTPTGLPVFGANATGNLLTWNLKTPNPIVPVKLVQVTVHWPVGSTANISGITFGSTIYAGNSAPPYLAVNTPYPLWSGAFDTRQMVFAFDRTPKSVAGDFYQVIAKFENCEPVSGIIPSE